MKRRLVEVVLLFVSFHLPGYLAGSPPTGSMTPYMIRYAAVAIPQTMLIVYILWIQREAKDDRFGLAGLRWQDLLHGLFLFVILLLLFFVFALLISLMPEAVRRAFAGGYRWRLDRPQLVPLALLFSLVVGYREEVFFRSYLLTRFVQMGASPALAVVFSTAVFSLGHIYQGWSGLVYAILHGIVFAVAFLNTRRLHVVAVAHGLYNFSVLLFGTVVTLGG